MKKKNLINIRHYDAKGQPWVMEHSLLLMRYKRTSRYVILSLVLLCLAVVVYLLLTKPGLPVAAESRSFIEGHRTRSDAGFYRELDLVRRQLHALITGSIENKVRRIEASLRGGKVTLADFETLQGLKDDLKVLKNYSFLDASRLSAAPKPKGLATGENVRTSAQLINNEQLIEEIGFLKNLLYISIASCGLLFLGMGGLWLRSDYRFKQLEGRSSRSPPLLDKPGAGVV